MKNILIVLSFFLFSSLYASGLNYNNTTKRVDIQSTTVTNVFKAADLPDTLSTGVYKLKASVSVDSLIIAANAQVWVIADGADKVLTLSGDGNLISNVASTYGLLTITGLTVVIPTDSATLFSLDGVIFSSREVNWLFNDSTGQSIGAIQNSAFSISIVESIFNGFKTGITVTNPVTRVFINQTTFISDSTGTGAVMSFGATNPNIEVKEIFFQIGSAECLFFIDSALTGTALIKDITNGAGDICEYSPTGLDRTAPKITNDLSKNIGSYVAVSNDSVTTIGADSTWYDFRFNEDRIKESSSNEQWTLVQDSIGLIRCDALNGLDGSLFASISVSSTGGTQTFEFRMLVNDTVTVDSVVLPRDISGTAGSIIFLSPLKTLLGDSVKLQGRNVDGTSDLNILGVSFIIQ